MVYRGYVRDGKIVMDEETRLPEGAEVEVTVRVNGESAVKEPATDGRSLMEELERIWSGVPKEEWDKLPPDLTDHLDHYVYGVDTE